MIQAVNADMSDDVAPVAAQAPMADTQMLDVAARIAMLEARTEEQDAALRQILEVMVQWAETQDKAEPAASMSVGNW